MRAWLSLALTTGFAAIADRIMHKLCIKTSLLCNSILLSGGFSYLFAF